MILVGMELSKVSSKNYGSLVIGVVWRICHSRSRAVVNKILRFAQGDSAVGNFDT